MTRLQQRIKELSEYGTHRTVIKLTGGTYPIKGFMQALKRKLLDTFDGFYHKVLWFKTSDGLVLMAAGSRFVPTVVDSHLASYEGGHQEHSVIYTGHSSTKFHAVASELLSDWQFSYRSFGGSRSI